MAVRSRVVVLGAGFGGLELTTILSDAFGDAIDIVLIDKSEAFVFGFSKLDVMFGRRMPADVRHSYRDIVKPGVRFLQSTIRSIDPAARRDHRQKLPLRPRGPKGCEVAKRIDLGAVLL